MRKGAITVEKSMNKSNYKEQPPRIAATDVNLMSKLRIKSMTAVFKALGDPVRLEMLNLLKQREDICTCEFQEILGLNQSAVSYHSKILINAGLIRREINGPWSHYSLVDKNILDKLFTEG